MRNTHYLQQCQSSEGCIDRCPHTFDELANTVLPSYLAKLQASLANPFLAIYFTNTPRYRDLLAKWLGFESDFSGCYVLQEEGKPIYVGISRSVRKRLRQHLLGEHDSTASLAHSMAKKKHVDATSTGEIIVGTRKLVMEQLKAGTAFKETQSYLRGLSIGVVPIENPLELYVFEAYATMALKTADWNTFRTH